MRILTVNKNDAGQRLDKFLSKAVKGLPTSMMYKLIRTKKIKVNRARAQQNQILCEGDEVEAAYAYCNLHGLWMAEKEEELVCDLQPIDTESVNNYTVCKCNKVSYFDILDAVNRHGSMDDLMNVFEDVKNTTKCSTGCGGCYDKVIAIISDTLMNGGATK